VEVWNYMIGEKLGVSWGRKWSVIKYLWCDVMTL